MKVEIKDRKTEVEYLRAALNMVELPVDYPTTELILKVQAKLAELGGELSLKDAIQIKTDWQETWDNYIKLQNKLKEKKDGEE